MRSYRSPTGSPILGTLERLIGRAEISGINEDGSPEYMGRTEIFWDDTKTITKDGKIVYLDDNGEQWTFDQLEKIDDQLE